MRTGPTVLMNKVTEKENPMLSRKISKTVRLMLVGVLLIGSLLAIAFWMLPPNTVSTRGTLISQPVVEEFNPVELLEQLELEDLGGDSADVFESNVPELDRLDLPEIVNEPIEEPGVIPDTEPEDHQWPSYIACYPSSYPVPSPWYLDRIKRNDRRNGVMIRGPSKRDDAVDQALKWLAAHQGRDGSWSFRHTGDPTCVNDCNGRCGNGGAVVGAKSDATALTIMSFLGAGQTQRAGKYQLVVSAGLRYLLQQLDREQGDKTITADNVFPSGLVVMAMSEAYAMSKVWPRNPTKSDESQQKHEKNELLRKALGSASQAALDRIRDTQDENSGGWRVRPDRPSCTSVTAWQLMGLKSGHLSHLRVRRKTILGASRFFDSVGADEYGSWYHRTTAKKRPMEQCKTATATALLCRMYMGWKLDHPGIVQGVRHLNKWGPSIGTGSTDMHYNFFATQVLFHYDGDLWRKNWNPKIRDYLVSTQARHSAGHAEGSWYFAGGSGSRECGRLYCTTMAAMTLQVYYRYLPIYRRGYETLEEKDDFKIDDQR